MNKCKTDTDRLRGYKIEIYPNEIQKKIILRSIDISRAVYNMAIEMQIENYNKKESFFITYNEMCKKMSDLRNNPDYVWLNGTTISTIRESLVDADIAFTKFFSNQNRFPKFKTKKKSKKSFGVRSERCEARENNIYISGIGLVEAKAHNIPNYTRLHKTRVSYDGHGRYYFSCTVEKDMVKLNNYNHYDPIGVDVGVRNMITTSDGDIYKLSDTTKYYKRLSRLKRRFNKHHKKYVTEANRARTKYEDVPKSKNTQKLSDKIFKTTRKISNKKLNDIHYATKQIVEKNPAAIVIEDLSLEKMRKTPWLNKYLPQVVFREIHRQLQYKADDRGIPIIKAPRDYPSSQFCSRCGSKRKTNNSIYICKSCGLRIDRDLNAAYNLRNFGRQNVNSTYEIIA